MVFVCVMYVFMVHQRLCINSDEAVERCSHLSRTGMLFMYGYVCSMIFCVVCVCYFMCCLCICMFS